MDSFKLAGCFMFYVWPFLVPFIGAAIVDAIIWIKERRRLRVGGHKTKYYV